MLELQSPKHGGQLTGSDLPSASFMQMVAKWCLTKPLSHWLNKPFAAALALVPKRLGLQGSEWQLNGLEHELETFAGSCCRAVHLEMSAC